jgi:hypothetical protein
MLALLTRMGLENLLLIMSRWDTGPPGRLGSELFRCVNEQCKELLRELQQAVRASFPPEELLRPDFVQHGDEQASASDGNTGEAGKTSATYSRTEDACADSVAWEEGTAEAGQFSATRLPAPPNASCFQQRVADCQLSKQWDMRPLGSTPPLWPPRRFHWVTQGIFDQNQRVRYMAHAAAARRAASLAEATNLDEEEALAAKAAFDEAQLEVIARSGFHVRKCPVNHRTCRQLAYSTLSAASASAATSEDAANVQDGHHHHKVLDATVAASMPGKAVDSDSDAEEKVAARRREAMENMTSEELLRLGAHLRMDRTSLEERLGTLSKASEVVIASTSVGDASLDPSPELGGRAGMTTLIPNLEKPGKRIIVKAA